ncbi:MAG: TolC family protein [Deltaproteobacteria bacterium]|nr:TolC family protein [Deltaproteobacteria bacterium]
MIFKLSLPILLIFAANAPAYAEIITFNDLPALVQANNRLIKAASSNLVAFKERTPFLTQSFLPNFTASTGRQVGEKSSTTDFAAGQSYRLEASLNLYNGGRDQLEEQVREDAHEVAHAELTRESALQLLAARRYFWQIVGLKSLMDLYDEAISATQKYGIAAKRRIDHGIATQSDLIQFELHGDTLLQDRKRLMLELDIAKSQLAVLIGSQDHVGLDVNGTLTHPSHAPVDLSESHLATNPDIHVFKGRIDSLRHQATQLSSSIHPQFDLFSDYGQPTYVGSGGNNQREWLLGLRLRFDLADALTDRRESKARLAQAYATELRLEDHKAKLTAFVHELKSELPLRHELLHDAAKNQERSEALLKLVADEYNRGIRNAAELLSAAEQRLGARRRLIEQTRDFYLTEAQLTSLSGT